MPKICLYFAPGACSRVTLIALESIGAAFGTRLVRFMKGEHRSAEYLRLNPKGKVPLLLIDEQPLTENVAMLTFLARCFPAAKLLPLTGDALHDALILADLAWCASGLHPIVTRLRLPQMICDAPGSEAATRRIATAAMAEQFAVIEHRLSGRDWLHGDWSVADAYLHWIWFRATGSGFDGSAYPRYAEHARRMEQRPAVQRALERERLAEAELEARGLVFKPGAVGR